jgi:hypothetical protein
VPHTHAALENRDLRNSSGSLAKFTAIRRVSSRVLCVLSDVGSWSAPSVMGALARVVHNRQGATDPDDNRRENNQ